MKDLLLIRHGRQDSTLCNTDVGLSDVGRRQAELLGRRLRAYPVEKIYSSALIRAVETAEIVNSFVKVPYSSNPGLNEIDFGELTGLTNEEIMEKLGAFIKESGGRKADIPYPGGECGRDVVNRAYPVLQKIASETDQCSVIVTHGGVIRSLVSELTGAGTDNKLLFGVDLENAGITWLKYKEENGWFYLERFNDAAHLEAKPELLRKGWKQSVQEGTR